MSKRIDSTQNISPISPGKPSRVEEFWFKSMDEYVDHVEPLWKCGGCWSPDFQGIDQGWEGLYDLARYGWKEKTPQLLDVTDKAVRMVEMDIDTFEPIHAIDGADVDISRFLDRTPENMIQYPLMKTSNIGSMVTICADVQAANVVSAQNMIARGALIASLAITLDRFGHQCEVWVGDEYQVGLERALIRCKIKGANDLIDPSRIMFACAHPGVQRGFGFTTVQSIDSSVRVDKSGNLTNLDGSPIPYGDMYLLRTLEGMGDRIHTRGFGDVVNLTRNLPEGTIYLPPINSSDSAPNAERELRMLLTQIGLIRGEDDE